MMSGARQRRPAEFPQRSAARLVNLAALAALCGCVSATPDTDRFLPRIAATPDLVDATPVDELERLQLVATTLVAALMQLPERNPITTTVQVSSATTAFGNTVIRALEDAGYGVQHVPADQGQHYLSYSRRYAETDAGPVTDFAIAIGEVRLRREFVRRDAAIVPSSLLFIDGSDHIGHVQLNDELFGEQGGVDARFVSGVSTSDGHTAPVAIGEVRIRQNASPPPDRRRSPETVLAEVRTQRLDAAFRLAPPPMTDHQRLRRVVLLFDNRASREMGNGNKRAVRLMARDRLADDVFRVRACTDVEGQNRQARTLGTRVIEEFVSHGVRAEQLFLAPCLRASFRHPSNDAPVPVEVVQFRRL